MGVILAKFRKEKSTYELLENLETKIKDIEDYSISTQERQKRFVGNFLVISIGLYVISSVIFYFAFFPSTWSKRVIYSTPLLIFPILIVLLKRVVAWFFQRKLNRNANQLKTLRAEKKKVIEQVMDKETYKVALEILNRFGDTASKIQHQQMTTGLRSTSVNQSPSAISLTTPQKHPVKPQSPVVPYGQQRQPMVTPQARTPINARSTMLSPELTPPYMRNTGVASGSGVTPVGSYGSQVAHLQARRVMQQTPYPIINQSQKSIFEKVVDYLIGDGPSSRYGMICKECFGHNGMVSQEEYEYSAFKCAFCKALNPAKKLRPIAPKLPMTMTAITTNDPLAAARSPSSLTRPVGYSSSSSASDKESSSDSEPVNITKELTDNIIDRQKPQLIEKHVDELPEKQVEQEEVPSVSEAKTTESEEYTSSEPKAAIDKKNE